MNTKEGFPVEAAADWSAAARWAESEQFLRHHCSFSRFRLAACRASTVVLGATNFSRCSYADTLQVFRTNKWPVRLHRLLAV